MKTIGKIVTILSLILLNCCKDEKLSLQRVPYLGNELRTDGYYYKYWASYDSPVPNNTTCLFLFRNGIVLCAGSFESTNLDTVDKELLERYKWLYEYKSSWGVFVVNGDRYEDEVWGSGFRLPVSKSIGIIDNDTTIHIIKHISVKEKQEFPQNYRYHFRQFSPKPDSTIANKWIK